MTSVVYPRNFQLLLLFSIIDGALIENGGRGGLAYCKVYVQHIYFLPIAVLIPLV